MKNILSILLISGFLFSCSDGDINVSDQNLKCSQHDKYSGEICRSKGFSNSDTINCILLYKNEPFSGRLDNWKRHEPTNYVLSVYHCEYYNGKRNGVETSEIWLDNKPLELTTRRWEDNIRISQKTEDVSYKWRGY